MVDLNLSFMPESLWFLGAMLPGAMSKATQYVPEKTRITCFLSYVEFRTKEKMTGM
jgi:hypothetical protein